jgi:ethanolamine kinase
MINREMEVTTHVLLAERGLASPLLARFQNGLLYKFFPGRVCTVHDLLQESMWRAVAARLGEWHARLPLPILKTETSSSEQDESSFVPKRGTDQPFRHSRTIWTVMQEWLNALPSKSEEERLQQQRLQAEFDKCFLELNGDRGEDSSNVRDPCCSIASPC